jgi:tRNA dimethylallyltransferase
MNRIIAIVGPTATGKSALAIQLALALSGEIVSADSRQVYRYMDIGTAKPSSEDRAKVPHHLIDIITPNEAFTLATYQELAFKAIDDIQRRDKLALLVGGSGLYVRAVTGGLSLPKVAPDPELRHKLEERAAQEGYQALYSELQNIDPAAAEKIDPHNVRRMIRALEVYLTAGVPFSQLKQSSPRVSTITIGLTTTRDDLYNSIDSRVDDMIERGLVDEVKGLLDRGYSPELPAMSGLGYKQIVAHLKGETSLEETVQRIKFETHRFARNQYAWFRPKDEHIHWFDIREEPLESIRNLITESARDIDLSKHRYNQF